MRTGNQADTRFGRFEDPELLAPEDDCASDEDWIKRQRGSMTGELFDSNGSSYAEKIFCVSSIIVRPLAAIFKIDEILAW